MLMWILASNEAEVAREGRLGNSQKQLNQKGEFKVSIQKESLIIIRQSPGHNFERVNIMRKKKNQQITTKNKSKLCKVVSHS